MAKVSCLDFGAVGDGTTDDTQAFRNLVDNAPYGEELIIPPRRYRITGTITIARAITLSGAGSTRKKYIIAGITLEELSCRVRALLDAAGSR